MFVGTGAGALLVGEGEVPGAFAAVDAPVEPPAGAPVPCGEAVDGKRPQSEGDGAGAAVSTSIPSSSSAASTAADALGVGVADATAGTTELGSGGGADAAATCDLAGALLAETNPSRSRKTNTPTAPRASTTSAVRPATAPPDIFRDWLTGTEIGAAALMLALTADTEACCCCCCCGCCAG